MSNLRIVEAAEPIEGVTVLEPHAAGRRILAYILLGLGLPLLILGVALIATQSGAQTLQASGLLAGMGAIMCGVALVLASKVDTPRAIRFNNKRRVVQVEDDTREGARAELPYDELSGIRVTRHRFTGGEGSHVAWALELSRRDGGFWVLATGDAKDVEQMRRQLASKVLIHGRGHCTVAAPTPETIHVETDDKRTAIAWRFRRARQRGFGVVGIVGGFLIIVLAANIDPLVKGVAAAVLGILAAWALLDGFSRANRSRELVVDDKYVVFRTRGPFGREVFKSEIGAIDTVLFFGGVGREETSIYLLERDDIKHIARYSRGEIRYEQAIEVLRSLRRVRRVDVDGCTLAERIHLEQLIQDAVKAHSGRKLD